MLAAVRINDERVEGALCVPSNIVQKNQNESYVMVVREESGKTLARKVNVTPGNSYGGKTVITSGLSAGDRIITMGYSEVTDGQTVKF
jgi:multidrug efflux pump subunit AcrA (membrane-fusion protein)